jgi:hypothetical protein
MNERLIAAYRELADMTHEVCGSTCNRRPPKSETRCCDREYCDFTAEYAKEEWGVDLVPTGHPTIPFMGEHGCVVEPHLRPMCTAHVCDINAFGFMREEPEPKWTKKYFRLREKICKLEYQRTGKLL